MDFGGRLSGSRVRVHSRSGPSIGAESASSESPIFIVGLSRSGTSMMRSMLNRLEPVWICPETHYFDDLRVRLRKHERAELGPRERRQCEDYFLGLSHKTYGRGGDPKSGRIDRKDLQDEVQRLGDGLDTYFEAYCRIVARSRGRTRWGEKTPRHVFRISEILDSFPNAKIICMIRDPRAVVSSYASWKRKKSPPADPSWEVERQRVRHSYNVVILSVLWRSAARAIMEARKQFEPERVYVQRYEDLVLEPERELRKLADWLVLEYSSAALEIPVVGSSFQTGEQGGVLTSSVERWREKLSPAEISVIQSCAGRALAEGGYQREPVSAPHREIALTWLGAPVALSRALVANRKRLGNPAVYVWRRLSLAARPRTRERAVVNNDSA